MKKALKYYKPMLIGLMAACVFTGCSSSGSTLGSSSEPTSETTSELISEETSETSTESTTELSSELTTESSLGSSSDASSDSKLENVVLEKDNKYSCTFEDIKHDFVISLPEESENAPLILMLHGAGDSAENFRATSGFDDDALPMGYAVCYVSGSSNVQAGRNNKSWNYGRFDPDIDYNDIGFLKALINYLVDEYSLDKDHVFCAGFSNGGYMNFRLAFEAQDTFLACASVSGDLCKTVWDKRAESNDVGMLAVYGELDEAVPKHFDGSGDRSLDPAIEDVIDYLASSNGLEKQSEGEIGNGSTIIKYGADSDEDIVWSVAVKDGKHGWPTEELDGFSVNKVILEFFENWR